MTIETDLQDVVSATSALNQTVQGQIDNINTTLTDAVADVDSTLDNAVSQAEADVNASLANGERKRWHIESIMIPETQITIDPARVIGSEYPLATSPDTPQNELDALNPFEVVDGFAMADQSIVVNPAEAFKDKYSTSTYTPTSNDAYNPTFDDENGVEQTCFADFGLWNYGIQLDRANYFNASQGNMQSAFKSGRQPYIVMRVGVQGANHRRNGTYISASRRWNGAHNGGQWRNISPTTITTAQEEQFGIGGHNGNGYYKNTADVGPNATAGTFEANNGIYYVGASGYGFGNTMGSNYGSWIAIPYKHGQQHENVRIWNWGYGPLCISAIGVAYSEYLA